MEYCTLPDYESWMTTDDPTADDDRIERRVWYKWKDSHRREERNEAERCPRKCAKAEMLFQQFTNNEPLTYQDILIIQYYFLA